MQTCVVVRNILKINGDVLSERFLFRYSAMMKPSRYSDQSLTRCKCWIVFSWLTSLLLCCPIVVAKMQVGSHFHYITIPSRATHTKYP